MKNIFYPISSECDTKFNIIDVSYTYAFYYNILPTVYFFQNNLKHIIKNISFMIRVDILILSYYTEKKENFPLPFIGKVHSISQL